MEAVLALAPTVGLQAACDHLAVARASFYRHVRSARRPALSGAIPPLPAQPARALSPDERAGVLGVLHEERFQDRAPAAIQAILLDEGHYFCSTHTLDI